MSDRLELHKLLCDILGSTNAYFQPPESVKMKYPAIKYSLNNMKIDHANNENYIQSVGYQLIVMDKDPDSEIAKKVSKLSMCSFDRSYTVDNLNHYVFTIYY